MDIDDAEVTFDKVDHGNDPTPSKNAISSIYENIVPTIKSISIRKVSIDKDGQMEKPTLTLKKNEI